MKMSNNKLFISWTIMGMVLVAVSNTLMAISITDALICFLIAAIYDQK